MTIYPEKSEEVLEIYTLGHTYTGEYPCHRSEWGINFWANQTAQLKIIKEEGNAAIIKEAGHHWRSGIGEFPYTPPKYYVGIFGMGTGHTGTVGSCFIAIYCIEYTKAYMKVAKDLALELMETLKKE